MPRSVAGGRTAATNRVAVQDIKSSLSFNGVSSEFRTNITPNPTGWCYAAWLKPLKVGAATYHYISCNTASFTNGFILARGANNSFIESNVYSSSTNIIGTTQINVSPNDWVHFVQTYLPNGICNTYINGTLFKSVISTGTMGSVAANTVTIGNRSYTNSYSGLKISDFVWQNTTTPWTQNQVTALYQRGAIPAGATVAYKFNEGAGATAYDSSGNGNHGTITAGTYTSDVPTKKRELVGGNLVNNGDFEYAPPFIAAQTANGRWLDGTAAGSSTKTVFDWAVIIGGASPIFMVSIDDTVSHSGTKSLKIVTGNASGWAAVSKYTSLGAQTQIPCLPSTSYTLTGWVKTTAGGNSGATIRLRELNGANGIVATTNSTALFGANDWTLLTVTVTTNAATRFLLPMLVYDPNAIGTAWFDDITLTPTVNTTRTAV